VLAILETVKPFCLAHIEVLSRRFPSDCDIAGVCVIVVVDRAKKVLQDVSPTECSCGGEEERLQAGRRCR
jgi:hypothetical protein